MARMRESMTLNIRNQSNQGTGEDDGPFTTAAAAADAAVGVMSISGSNNIGLCVTGHHHHPQQAQQCNSTSSNSSVNKAGGALLPAVLPNCYRYEEDDDTSILEAALLVSCRPGEK
jgi:hypothetical protein